MAVTRDGTPSSEALDDYFAVLGNARRDAVVGVLAGEDRPVRLSRLAERVAAETRTDSSGNPTERDVERLQVELHHNHLPKLDEAGVVDYAPEDGRVAPAEGLAAVDRLRRAARAI